jgi:nicotinamide riboside kinase
MMRIAITGPECSGKTTLAAALQAALPNAVVVPEMARSYLESSGIGINYSAADVLHIAHLQHKALNEAVRSDAQVVVSDTDFAVLCVWTDVVYGKVDPDIYALFQSFEFDMYLLCRPDLPWEFDPLRQNPTDRDALFERYVQLLESHGLLIHPHCWR